jgi:hypothetical protein
MTGQLLQPRDKVLQYIEAVLVNGYTKKDAFQAFIDSEVKNPHQAIAKMESKKEYQELYAVITSDENYKFQIQAQRVRGKYLNFIEKNIDTADQMLDDAKKEDLRTRAAVVRLSNETIQAMAVVSGGPQPPQQPGTMRLDRSSVVS